MITSRISSGVTPLRIAARTCIGSSFSARSAVSSASVRHERVRRSRPGRAHTSPHATRVRYSWNGAPYSDAPPSVRSTCSSPSTSRRTRSPSSISPPGRRSPAPGRRALPPSRGSRRGRAARPRAPRRRAPPPRRGSRRPPAPRAVSASPASPFTRSAISRPPVASRFARIRCGSTSRPSSDSRSHATADPVERSSSPSGRHSACHEPAARSCSCAIAPSSVAASPGACCAHASAQIAATGLRLCGIAEEPPPLRLAHLGDLGLGEQHDVARDLRHRAGGHRQRRRELADPPPQRVPRQHRLGQPERRRVGLGHARPGLAERGQRARRAAELRREALDADLVEPAPRVLQARHPARGLEPERDRHRLLEQRAARQRRVAVGARELRRRAARREQVVEQRVERARGHEHRRGVEDVLARRPAVHVRGRRALDGRGQRRLERHHGVARAGRRGRDRRGVEALGDARAPRSPPPPRRRSRPRVASARASAASASSMACSQPWSETAAAASPRAAIASNTLR